MWNVHAVRVPLRAHGVEKLHIAEEIADELAAERKAVHELREIIARIFVQDRVESRRRRQDWANKMNSFVAMYVFSGVRPVSGAAVLSAGEGFWIRNVAAAEDGSTPCAKRIPRRTGARTAMSASSLADGTRGQGCPRSEKSSRVATIWRDTDRVQLCATLQR